MFASIRTRLTLSHLAVIIVAMGLSGLLLLSLLERYFLEAMEDSLAAQAQITAQALIPGAMAEGVVEPPASAWNTIQQRQSNISLQAQNVAPPEAENPVLEADLGYLADASLELSTQLDTRIRLLDAGGFVLVDSQGEDQGADLRSEELVALALGGQQASRTEQAGPQPAMHLALLSTGFGEKDQALSWLERSFEERDNALYLSIRDFRLDPLRSDPRFQKLIGQMNLPD